MGSQIETGQGASAASAILDSRIDSLPLIARGKVRDNYAVGETNMLMVASDRISAFDVIMGEPIPGKGIVLTRLAQFWFEQLQGLVPNHLTGIDPQSVVAPSEVAQVRGRAMVVKKLRPLPVEAVVRGYIIGSGWADYQRTGAICGITLPSGLQLAQQLDSPIFTPASKADVGDHDENISFAQMVDTVGQSLAESIREISVQLYLKARDIAAQKGIIIADTKFEFGLDDNDQLTLMDEVLTPDSSRFWPADQYQVGMSPPSFDKQFVRDYLESLPDWNKQPPAPALPDDIIAATAAKYHEALRLFTSEE